MQARYSSAVGCVVLWMIAVGHLAHGAGVDPVGSWNLAVQLPDGGALNLVLKLEEKDGDLTGLLLGEDGSETEITDADYSDGELSFKISRDFGGQELKSSFKGKLTDDEFKGTVDFELGADSGTLDVVGERERIIALSGTWLLIATSDGGTFEPKLHLKHEGDSITGRYVWVDESEVEIEDCKLADGELCFKVRHDFGGRDLVVLFKVKPNGDALSGTADYDLDGETGTAKIEGSKAANVAGTWNINLTGPNGEAVEAMLKLAQDGKEITGEYSGPAGDAKISDAELDGKLLSFSVTRERDGESLVVTYKGEVRGDSMSGDVEFEYGGQTMTGQFEAKRAK
jgi:hypothetical protein